jgi:plastocyanin
MNVFSRRAALAAAMLATAAAAFTVPRATRATGAGATITIDNFSFTPATLTVAAGTKVTWTNRDDSPHTIVNTQRAFKSAPLDTGDTFSAVFDKSGTFGYFCSLHPHMQGTIVVK